MMEVAEDEAEVEASGCGSESAGRGVLGWIDSMSVWAFMSGGQEWRDGEIRGRGQRRRQKKRRQVGGRRGAWGHVVFRIQVGVLGKDVNGKHKHTLSAPFLNTSRKPPSMSSIRPSISVPISRRRTPRSPSSVAYHLITSPSLQVLSIDYTSGTYV